MPEFHSTRLVGTRELRGWRVVCDGCDPARPCEEHVDGAALWFVSAGAFELRDAEGTHVVDPTQALLMPTGHAYTIRHPAGPDTCVAFRGPLINRLVGARGRRVSLPPAAVARINAELAAWRRGEGDELALAESLTAIAATRGADRDVRTDDRDSASPFGGKAGACDRALADAITRDLRLHFAESTTLGELADTTGYSIFHACRVFRATTGHTIHGFRRELRLRHALARILGGDEPLIAIAADAGFASQSHLTNLFRARFGITPARARTREGMRQLAA